MLWLLSTPVVSDYLADELNTVPTPSAVDMKSAECVVVLGGGVRLGAREYGGAAPDAVTLTRLSYAAYLVHRTGLPLLASGGDPEAFAMRSVLMGSFNIPVRWMDSKSRNTHDNALYSASILKGAGIDRILLVTSATHMPRAVREFRSAGVQVVPAPTSSDLRIYQGPTRWLPNAKALLQSRAVLYERLAELVYSML